MTTSIALEGFLSEV